jgi:hypothetical protein
MDEMLGFLFLMLVIVVYITLFVGACALLGAWGLFIGIPLAALLPWAVGQIENRC